MFGFGVKRKCMYCEMELPLLGDTCTYCGQKQKADPLAVMSASERVSADFAAEQAPAKSKSPLPARIAAPVAQVINAVQRAQSFKAKREAPAVKREGCAVKILRLIFAASWLFLIAELADNFRSDSPYAGIFDEFAGLMSAVAGLLVIAFAGQNILWRLAIIPVTFLNASILLLKPVQYPIVSTWTNFDGTATTHALSYTSETHLFFVLPGLALLVLGVINVFALFRAIWLRFSAWGR